MSLCVRYAGDSYRYLLDSVTTDHGPAATTPMTRYYIAAGTPPGTWLGTGLAGLAAGVGIPAGSYVTPRHMERLFRDATDPATDASLGRPPHVYDTADGRDRRRPVAGFDCTFTAPKSVSVLWALADPATREIVYDCHRTAVADIVALIERDVARTRIGTNGAAQVETRGVIAAAFDHWDSRLNDPNLHTHLVIANRVQGLDGRWRTLDSRAMHRAAVALSERYDGLLADHITARLGLAWEYRERGPQRNPAYELAAVPAALTELFSSRSVAITTETERLIGAYLADHGRRPDPVMVLKLRQQATLATRDAKEVHSLADLTDQWRRRAAATVDKDPVAWSAQLLATPRPDGLLEAEVRAPVDHADQVLAALSRTRSTWTPWNVDAEASRALKAVRYASASDRDRATAAVVAEVARRAVLLSSPELASTPQVLRRADGSSGFRAHRGERYTSRLLLDAEARLVNAGRESSGPALAPALGGSTASAELFNDQHTAVAAIATSGRVVDVLVGPAGSGKTRTLGALRAVWESQYGPGSVVGLAPSAAAADVLGDALGITAENTAKWLVEHDREGDRLRRIERIGTALQTAPDQDTQRKLAAHLTRLTADVQRWRFHPGQLIVVDEASLAGTLTLDRLSACAGEAGAKLLLVGDPAQLSAIEAGGAFGLLVQDRGTEVPELSGVRRFNEAWEREASTRLRSGDLSCIDTYAARGRLTAGEHDAMVEAAYTAWVVDEHAGHRSLLLAGDLHTVRTLNERAHAELVGCGRVEPVGTRLRDGLVAGVGDRVVTRRNDRHLSAGRGWVKNGDQWTVISRGGDGALGLQRANGGCIVELPADYVAQHVELAYATTAFRAQGATVDTAHAIVTGPGMTREVLYVMLTRARLSNRAYISTDRPVEPLEGFTDDPSSGRSVLAAVLRNVGASTAAHEVIQIEQESAESIRTLAAEYETIAHLAQAPRWAAMLADAGLTPGQISAVEESPAYGARAVALRRAEANNLPVARALRRLAERAQAGADDLAAVLHDRVTRWTVAAVASGGAARPQLVAGLVPEARDVDEPEMANALKERARLIEARVDALLDRAQAAGAPWLSSMGLSPAPEVGRWPIAARAVAAYRDRYNITDPERPVGSGTTRSQQQADRDSVVTLLEPFQRNAEPAHTGPRPAPALALATDCQTVLQR